MQKKKGKTKQIVSIILCSLLAIAMLVTGIAPVFAETTESSLNPVDENTIQIEGETLILEDAVSSEAASAVFLNDNAVINPDKYYEGSQPTVYQAQGSSWQDYTIQMPVKGTLIISGTTSNYYCDLSSVEYADNPSYIRLYRASAGTIDMSAEPGLMFTVEYVPVSTTTYKAGSSEKTIYQAVPNGDKTQIKFNVPGKGYLRLNLGSVSAYSFQLKTAGFKEYEYYTKNNKYVYIGVKKGTYTVDLKTYAALAGVKYKFVSVKESKYGTSRDNAGTLKKGGDARKGVIITNSKKTHWYKIKNTKKQKGVLHVDASKISNGGTLGGIKITVRFPDKTTQSTTLYARSKGKYDIVYDNIGGSKMKKGTYYIKIQSYNGGNGYFTVKLK